MPWLAALFLLTMSMSACVGARPVRLAPVAAGPTGDLRLWQDADIFQPVGRLLAVGRVVWVEMYEFDRPDLETALLAARTRGADVRLIIDPSVSVSARTLSRLRAAGLAARPYPLDDRRHQIDHVKLLVTDAAALVGGMNWGRRSSANHDYAFEVRAPPLLERLRRIFEQDWSLAGGAPAAPVAAAVAGSLVAAQTTPGQEIRGLLEPLLARAGRRVWAEIFALTDPDVIAALAAAHRRGVDVRVLLDPGQDVNRAAYRLLASVGVAVRWYPVPAGAKLHAKAGLFDDRLLLGSANWTLSGLSVNHELDLMTDDGPAVAAFSQRYGTDWEAAGRPLTAGWWGG